MLKIERIIENKKHFLDLLLLADEQESMIDKYLPGGDLFALYDSDLKSVCVVVPVNNETCELKNIATYEKYQGKGYERALINFIFDFYKNYYKTMLVGTGETPEILSFYESFGFEKSHRIKNFFIDNYDHPIFEGNIQLIDMIYLKKNLTEQMDKTLTFPDRQSFREWLGKYAPESDGVWLLFAKKGDIVTLSAGDALEEALCHGWIDGQIQSLDENTYKKYFARRLPKSKWSAKNKELAQTLMEKGLMTKQGFEAIERAGKNGSWNKERIRIDDEQIQIFKQIIQPYEPAYSNLLAMSNSIQRTYTEFYFDAKTDKTRTTRLEKIIDRLNKNLKPM